MPHYARVEPELFGLPFFFCYQFLWVFICSARAYGDPDDIPGNAPAR